MSPEGRELIGAMLARDYPSRITAKQALQHPWWAHGR
jgi:serine/threonine protein kinase